MCTDKGVYLSSLAPNPDGNTASRKLKQVSKIYESKVKFMQTYRQLLFIVGSDLIEETADFSPKQVTVLKENSSQILARLRFNESVVFFKIHATILIVSAGGGLYIFSLTNFKKVESLQCNSIFQTYMSMVHGTDDVEIFRIVFTDPSNVGRLNIFSCKQTTSLTTISFVHS